MDLSRRNYIRYFYIFFYIYFFYDHIDRLFRWRESIDVTSPDIRMLSHIPADKLGKHAVDVKFLMWLVLCS